MGAELARNALLFGRVLRGLGLEVGPGRMRDFLAALGHIEVGRKADFRHAAKSLLVNRHEDIALFDAAFDAFWRQPGAGATSLDLRAMGERRRFRRPRFGPPPLAAPATEANREARPAAAPEPPLLQATLTYSPDERLRLKDFAELTAEELAEVEARIVALAWRIRRRRTRRLKPGRGLGADLRRSLRRSLRHGGELLEWAERERKRRPRPLVILADISGSMERYTRLLLIFIYGLAAGLPSRVEVFVFGTRLTRVTRKLRGNDPDAALREVARSVSDWSGGTRIGASVHSFNFEWGRRVLAQGPVVLLISDGWDRGDARLLSQEMERLQRSCHRLIWLNPLLGAKDYEPLARGMRAALPFVDDFLPVHDLASLEQLAETLHSLPERRRARAVASRGPMAEVRDEPGLGPAGGRHDA